MAIFIPIQRKWHFLTNRNRIKGGISKVELNFEVYNDNGDMVAQIQVFDDGSFWIKNDEEHAVAVNEVEEDDEELQVWHGGVLNIDAEAIITAGKMRQDALTAQISANLTSQINSLDDKINLKADQSEVDALSGAVDTISNK